MSLTSWIDGRIEKAAAAAGKAAAAEMVGELDAKLNHLEANVGAMFITVSADVDKVADAVTHGIEQFGDIPEQVIAKMPDFGAIITTAIRQFNPFAR